MIIYLGALLPKHSCTLPNLRLHQAGFAPRRVTTVMRALLPHDLTLTDPPKADRRYVSVALIPRFYPWFPLGTTMTHRNGGVRTFLHTWLILAKHGDHLASLNRLFVSKKRVFVKCTQVLSGFYDCLKGLNSVPHQYSTYWIRLYPFLNVLRKFLIVAPEF